MLDNLRSVALLMLVAGVCLGVFASTLVAQKPATVRPTLDQKIEERVKLYREFYALDADQTDGVRRELQRHRRALRDMLMDLRQRHQEEFTQLVRTTEARIDDLIRGTR